MRPLSLTDSTVLLRSVGNSGKKEWGDEEKKIYDLRRERLVRDQSNGLMETPACFGIFLIFLFLFFELKLFYFD